MMGRRKDSGFTLIELMIVIAVIGILAIVLVPRIGTIKSQAKEAGLDTNVRVVQAYVESKIDKWVANKVKQSDVVAEIVNAFTFTDTSKQLVNPITSEAANAVSAPDTDAISANSSVVVLQPHNNNEPPDLSTTIPNAEGAVLVTVKAANENSKVEKVSIFAYGTGGKLLTDKTVVITP
ncbi:MAG TPA: type II secretion system protein [Peptococcaceae bacterium]|nr:type II secretion system protein [Peptococcaceae bacterium]